MVPQQLTQVLEEEIKKKEGIDEENEDVEEELQEVASEETKLEEIDLIIHSGGGDIDAAYHIVQILSENAEKVNVVVPRMAKSAATLISCGADCIVMDETSELGPLDAQLPHNDGRISVLSLDRAMDKIEEQYDRGNENVADSLNDQLDVLEIGEMDRAKEVSKDYIAKALTKRMFEDKEEARSIGLEVEDMDDQEAQIIRQIHAQLEELQRLQQIEQQLQEHQTIKKLINDDLINVD